MSRNLTFFSKDFTSAFSSNRKIRVDFRNRWTYNITMMDENYELSEQYKTIEKAIGYLEENFQDQPSLEEIAASVHLSKYHFQRTFKRWAGVTPSQFLHYLTVEYAKERLREAQSVLDTTVDAGLSSPGRLHDLFVTFEAMTPGEYKNLGEDLVISYGIHPTPFGDCLLATTERGICALRFIPPIGEGEVIEQLKDEWPEATFKREQESTGEIARELFSPYEPGKRREFHLHLKGTNFQYQVWQALLKVPSGSMVTYGDVAEKMGRPSATRAVANAVANNPVAYLIPCHRVIRSTGKTHQYRWGTTRKKAILGWEAAQTQGMMGMRK
jgi:AraC family transcriptional regulator of adaptative response/methylated-DNA-[protein]-cysteine methyltransferase